MIAEETNLLPNRAKSAAFIAKPRNYEQFKAGSHVRNQYNNDETYYTPRLPQERLEDPSVNLFDNRLTGSSSSFFKPDFSNASIQDIVNAKNVTSRIADLERTNLRLRRMIEYASNDNLNERQPVESGFESNRTFRENLLGPPVLRQGRIGSSWRHIKQTNNYSNSNFLFVDGTVRIDDSARYPPRMYGYPPKVNVATHRQLSGRSYHPQDRIQSARPVRSYADSSSLQQNMELVGLGSRSMTHLNLPVNNIVSSRPLNLNPYENKYHVRAKEGFEYWNKDKRYPENNKPKAKQYTTGAYKTFHGLSDALLKT